MSNKLNTKYLFIGGISLVILFWILNCFVLPLLIKEPNERAQFGEMFGAINSLFSGLTLCGIAYTVYLQHVSNRKSEYHFRLNQLINIINKQTLIFNERIIEFYFNKLDTETSIDLNFNHAIKYFKTLNDNIQDIEQFAHINGGSIDSLITFIHDSTTFVSNLIDYEDISLDDKGKLMKLYTRGLNGNLINFLPLMNESLKLNKEKLDALENGFKDIYESIYNIKRSRIKDIYMHLDYSNN